MSTPFSVGFLGAGQMATALAKGWAAAGLLNVADCFASDLYPTAGEKFHAATGIAVGPSNAAVVERCRVLVLAVKPQAMAALLAEIRPLLTPQHIVVSIAAGVTLKQLQNGFGEPVRVVRVMPNTPALIGKCAAGFALGAAATDEDASLVERLFRAVGVAFQLPETLLDAVTGVSGSGPAYAYLFIEALADGGVKMGLPRDVALKLAAQTVLGAAQMVLETGQHPAVLKDAVTSPGGTTIAGLHALEAAAFRAAAMGAVEAATRRAAELGGIPAS